MLEVHLNGDAATIKLHLSSFNEGVKGKYYFMRGDFQPNIFSDLNFAHGTIKSAHRSDIGSEGVSLSGGSQWSKKIFTNSDNTGFNNGFYGFFGSLICLW